MKKATSFLLALVMLVSLLPGTAVTVAAAEAESLVPTQNNYYSEVVVNKKIGDLVVSNGNSADEHYTTLGSAYTVHFKTGTMSADGTRKAVATAYFGQNKNGSLDVNRGFEVSFEATFNDLVVLDTSVSASEAYEAGFSVEVGGVDRYGFHADANGNIYVTRYDAGEPVRFDTGADLGDKNVKVRIVTDDQRNATVVVDGYYVGRFATPQVDGTVGEGLSLYTGTMYRSGDAHTNDVTVYNNLLLTQAPIAEELQAYYTYDEPYIDGVHDEENWAFDNGNHIALLSDENYLYIAVLNTDPAPEFVINGVTLTSNPADGTVTMADGKWAGKIAKNGNVSEIKIPLKSVLGLDFAPGQKVGFTYAWDKFDGAAMLAGRTLVSYEGFDGALTSGTEANEVYAKQAGSALQLKAGTYSAGGTQTVHHKMISPAQMVLTDNLEIEFTADFNNLVVPVENDPVRWYAAGVSVELRADPCRNYGFHADAAGNVYITQRMDAAADVTRVDLGIDVGATGVNVRLSVGDNGETTIYVNGVVCSDTLPKSTFSCPKTGGRGYYQINNSTRFRDTESARLNDVTLYNLVLTQDAPMPEAREYNMADNGNADITAYMNPNGIDTDGVLSEAEWYVAQPVAGVAGTPSGLVGFSWGNGNLYVGVESEAEIATLTVGGQRLVANPRPYQVPRSGELFVSNTGFEWVIPLSRFGLPEGVLNEQIQYEISLGSNQEEDCSSVQGTLTFSGEQMLLGDSGRLYSGTDYYLGTGDGHTHWERSIDGYVVTAEGLNEMKDDGGIYAAGTFVQKNSIPVDYTKGAFDLSMTMTVNDLPNLASSAAFGMRGLIFELCGEKMRAAFALRKDANGTIWMDIRDTLDVQQASTKVKVGTGEKLNILISMDDKQSISLYVNGEFVHAFAPIDRRDLTATAVQLPIPHFMWGVYNSDRDLNAGGGVSVVDVVVHDLKLTTTPYAAEEAVVKGALDQITEASILPDGDPDDVTVLALPTVVYVDGIREPVSVSWSATDKLTGRTAYGVNVNSGIVTRAATTQAFDLKALVSYGNVTESKIFTFQTKGEVKDDQEERPESNVALIENDNVPAAGAVTVWEGDKYVYLDNTHNSIVINQGSSIAFNRILLRDTDNYSRVSQRHLGVFISDDGENWTKVTGWLLHQSGRNYTLYNLNATAQYVKVHCYHDDLDLKEGPTFYNKVSEMIKVSYENALPGAAGKFANTTTFSATNDTDNEKKDTPVFISLATLGAKSGEYQTSCADFRFTLANETETVADDMVLAHWYNGEDGFYVRVPSIPAKGSTTVTAHWGCGRVEDFSDGEAVFEVTYGNVSIMNLSRDTYNSSGGDLEQSLLSHGRPFTFPNGEVIVVGRTMKAASNVAVFRSTDGGHTFHFDNMAYRDGDYVGAVAYAAGTSGATNGRSSGFGGFLWDDSVKTEKDGVKYEGRLFLLAYSGKGNNTSDYRITVSYSDDYGRTWSEPKFLSLPGSDDIYKKGTTESAVSWLENADVRVTGTEVAKRAITYCDGLTVKAKDASGKEFNRYVIIHNDTVYSAATPTEVLEDNMKAKQLRNVTTAIYSDDGGQTWYCSDTLISMPGVDLSRNNEDGTTEAGFAQLDDGSLRLVIRAQQEGNYYLYEGISTDYGKTWTSDYSNVLSSNTAPMLMKYGTDRLQLWSACTGLGQTSYRRTPLHLGLSTDNYASFDKIVDLTFATAFDSVKAVEGRKTQTGIAITKEGTSAFVSYHDQNWHENEGAWTTSEGKYAEKGGTMGLLIEEFDQMIYGTKGAWDDFEDSSLKYQGWLVDADGAIELSGEQAVSGKYSMKVLDKTSGSPAHALRQIPSMKSGTVGAKIMVPETNEAPYFMELKAAYNYDHMKFTIAAIYVTPNGTVGYVDANKVQHALTTVTAGSWNDCALSFDVETGKATLTVNGEPFGPFDLPELEKDVDLMHGVTVVQFNQNAATKATGDCAYVDDFFANELVTLNRVLEEDTAAQSIIGRFMTIVRKVIEVNGEQVEIVEWAWMPGL